MSQRNSIVSHSRIESHSKLAIIVSNAATASSHRYFFFLCLVFHSHCLFVSHAPKSWFSVVCNFQQFENLFLRINLFSEWHKVEIVCMLRLLWLLPIRAHLCVVCTSLAFYTFFFVCFSYMIRALCGVSSIASSTLELDLDSVVGTGDESVCFSRWAIREM